MGLDANSGGGMTSVRKCVQVTLNSTHWSLSDPRKGFLFFCLI